MTNSKCQFCQGESFTTFQTYKHLWYSCDTCGNMFCTKKTKYFLSPVASFLLNGTTKRIITKLPFGRTFLSYLTFLMPGLDSVDLYDEYLADGKSDSSGTAYQGIAQKILDEFKGYEISFTDKSVLDISGGPGYVIKELSRHCANVVVSEYSPNTVRRMSEVLELPSFQYDFNKDDISEKTNEKFDIVLIRHSLNFCLDVNQLLKSLKKALNKDAIIYVTFVTPTLATCVRWQFEDYIYHTLFNPETVSKIFAQEGFDEISKHYTVDSYYMDGKKLLFPIMYPYRIINSRKNNINVDLNTKGAVMVFKLKNEI